MALKLVSRLVHQLSPSSTVETLLIEKDTEDDLSVDIYNMWTPYFSLITTVSPPKLQRLSDGSLFNTSDSTLISVSHKDTLLMISRCYSSEIRSFGIDLEVNSNLAVDWRSFQGRFFTIQDWLSAQLFKQHKNLTIQETMLIFFSAKEAVLKCTRLKADPLKFSIKFDLKSDSLWADFSDDTISEERTYIQSIQRNNSVICFAYQLSSGAHSVLF